MGALLRNPYAHRAMDGDESTRIQQCRHHWLLGQPSEGIVQGRCRDCGAEREYSAFLDDYGFEADRAIVREDGWRRAPAVHARPGLSISQELSAPSLEG
jgi:hypothetical protein